MKFLKRTALYYKNAVLTHQNLYLVAIAVVIGLAAGGGSILFRAMIAVTESLSYGESGSAVLPDISRTPFWRVLLMPALGGLIVGVIYGFAKIPRPSIALVTKHIIVKKWLSPITALITAITSAITIGTGGSAGKAGPIIQIGAGLGSWVGKLCRLPVSRVRFVITAGAGSGLAAIFNAPMAGAMFTAEALLGRLEFKVFAPAVIACVAATELSRAYFGGDSTFTAPAYVLSHWYEFFIYAVLGVAAGIFGALFLKVYFYVSKRFQDLKIPTFLKPALGGLIVGAIGLAAPDVIGVGYKAVSDILAGEVSGAFLFMFLALKMLATCLTLGSGGAGGLFMPLLFTGASVGGLVGWLFSFLLPDISVGSYAFIGMGAVLAATMRTPITSMLLIFEISQSYQVVLPIMTATVIAHMCASWLEKESFITRPLKEQGLNFSLAGELSLLEQTYVKEIMLKNALAFREDTPLLTMVEEIRRHPFQFFPVLDEKGILKGSLALKDLRGALFDPYGDKEKLTAKDFCKQKPLYVTPNHTLSEALAVFGINREVEDLPVAKESSKGAFFVGLLRRSDILKAMAGG